MPTRRADADTLIDLAATLADRSRGRRRSDAGGRSGMTERERSLVKVAALVALYGREQLGLAIEHALRSGVAQDEIADLITGLECHVGWPAAMSAALWARDVFDKPS